jgi:uncharacterized delta-60 repeat protein
MLSAGTVEFSAATLSVDDTAGTVPIVINRTDGSSGAVSVKLATSNGTALAGTDYNAISGTVNFADGVTTAKVNLKVFSDPVANLPARTVNLALSNPSGGASLGSTSEAVLSITHVAAPGDLDGSFGVNGRVANQDGPTDVAFGWAMPISRALIAPDGSSYSVSNLDITSPALEINKFKPDGSPDTSYGDTGLASVALPGDAEVAGVAFQPDGKIIVAGNSDNSTGPTLEVVRFNTDGTPDSTFGQNGVAVLQVPPEYAGVTGGVAALTDGQIVVTERYSSAGLVLAALGADGSPSLTFGSGGFASTTLGPLGSGDGQVVAMSDGTCVVSGSLGSGGAQQLALWRFNADGTLDTAFGSGGIALGLGMGDFGYGELSLAPNGDIVQLGEGGGGENGSGGGVIAFYTNAGRPDTSFAQAGEFHFAAGGPTAVAFQPNGQLIAAGVSADGMHITVTRLNADGSLDTHFGRQGTLETPNSSTNDEAPGAIAFLPGNLILVAGTRGGMSELNRYIAPVLKQTPKITWANPADITVGTPLGATQLDATASVAGTFTYNPAAGTLLRAGDSQVITATFTPADSTDYTSASAQVRINVLPSNTKANTKTSLTPSVNAPVFGQSVTFTAVVSVVSPGSGIPSDVVTFKDGTTVLGSSELSNANGASTATLTTSALSVGSHSITAVYGGGTRYVGSTSSALSINVAKGSTKTVVTSSAKAPVFGEGVTFTAVVSTVAPASGKPASTVTFKDGAVVLGTVKVKLVNGISTATFATTTLRPGAHLITAIFAGGPSFTGSASNALGLTVGKDSTTIKLQASANPATANKPVTFTASLGVVVPGAGVPTGDVTFKDGTKTLGTAKITIKNGVAIATFTTSSLAVGKHTITGLYSGDSADKPSISGSLNLTAHG